MLHVHIECRYKCNNINHVFVFCSDALNTYIYLFICKCKICKCPFAIISDQSFGKPKPASNCMRFCTSFEITLQNILYTQVFTNLLNGTSTINIASHVSLSKYALEYLFCLFFQYKNLNIFKSRYVHIHDVYNHDIWGNKKCCILWKQINNSFLCFTNLFPHFQ